MTQKDIAKKLKISVDAYREKERGNSQFRADEMFILSEFFGKPIEQIFLRRNICNTDIIGAEIKGGHVDE